MVRDNNGVARAWLGECETCMVSSLSAMLGLKLNHVTKREPRKIAKLHECKHLRAHHSDTESQILYLDAHETAVRYSTILENTLLQSTRGIIRLTFVIKTIMLHLTMPGQSPAKGFHQNGAAREVVWLQPHRTYFGKLGMCSQREPASGSAAFSTQNPLPQADYYPWDVCPYINQTNFNMAMREKYILSNFGSAFIKSCFCPLSGTMQIETIESL